MASSAWAAIAAAAVFLAIIPLGTLNYWLTTLLAAVYSLVRFLEMPESRWCYLCGLFVGITLLLRQDAGAYLAAGVFAFIYAGPSRSQRLRALAKALAVSLAVVGLVLGYLATQGALAPMIDSAVRFAIFQFPQARPLPYPLPWPRSVQSSAAMRRRSGWDSYTNCWASSILPAALTVFSALTLTRLSRSGCERGALIAASLFCAALLMFLMVRVRPSGARIVAAAIVGAAAFAAMAADGSKAVRLGAWAMLASSILVFGTFGAYTIWAQRACCRDLIGGQGGVYGEPGQAALISTVSARIKKITSLLKGSSVGHRTYTFRPARPSDSLLRTPSVGHRRH